MHYYDLTCSIEYKTKRTHVQMWGFQNSMRRRPWAGRPSHQSNLKFRFRMTVSNVVHEDRRWVENEDRSD